MDNKYTVFETSIIGFFVGIIIATYNTYIVSMDGYLGNILNWLSLKPLINQLIILSNNSIFIDFSITLIAFIVYGVIVGLFIKFTHKPMIIVSVVALFLICGIAEQYISSKYLNTISSTTYHPVASVIVAKGKLPSKYFGTEARGDLNGDGIDDVAFIINRNDKDRGVLYYLSSAINVADGYNGTNLLFLGDKVKPNNIKIVDQMITLDISKENSSTTRLFYARLNGTELIQATTSTTTSSI
jgi:hypothetical protein